MTMLAGAIGNGNIAGVATAIAIGGPGAIFEVKTVWDYADTMNGPQIFPNLIALIILAPQVVAATRSYFNPTTSK